MEGFMANVVKYLLFITNFLVFLMACVVFGFGIWALVDGNSLNSLVQKGDPDLNIDIYTTAAITLIVVSAFIIIVTFFGCCGALKENRCMLGTYFVIILALFIIVIIGAVLGYSQSLEKIQEPLLKSMKNYKNDPVSEDDKAVKNSWDQIQTDFTCCGVESYNDWHEQNEDEFRSNQVPESCCASISDESCPNSFSSHSSQVPGCITKLKEKIEDNSGTIMWVAIAIVIIMFLNMICAFAMCTMIH